MFLMNEGLGMPDMTKSNGISYVAGRDMLSRPQCFVLGRGGGPLTKRKRRVYKTRRAHSAYPGPLRKSRPVAIAYPVTLRTPSRFGIQAVAGRDL